MTIIEAVEKLEADYKGRQIELIDGLFYNQFDTIRTVEFYSNSKYLKGNIDELGKEKPFYNINKFRVNVAVRATDLDIKDIQISADGAEFYNEAWLLGKEAYEWMKTSHFDVFLNDMGKTRAKYGGVLVKKCIEKEEGKEELELEVVNWKNAITDQVNIEDGVIIEKHFLLPEELMEKAEVWDKSDLNEILKTAQKSKDYDGRLCVYEVHGMFPESYFEKNGSEFDYKRYSAILYMGGKKKEVLFYEEEKENPYKYLAWDKIPGRGLGAGIVEDGFEAQVWTNDLMIKETRITELASKIVLKTNSKKAGNNVLTDVDNGHIFELEDGGDINVLSLTPTSLPELGNLAQRWDNQFERVSSTFNAITGEQMPSGTPYRQTAILNSEASSLFDYRREEAGIFVAELFYDWVIPFLIKKLKKQHVLKSDFTDDELNRIDEGFKKYKAKRTVIGKVLEGATPNEVDYTSELENISKELNMTGNERYIEVPEGYFDRIEYKVSVVTTGENRNKAAILETLNNILLTVSKNPAILQDPIMLGIFRKIADVAGVSPAELGLSQQAVAQQVAQPQMQNEQIAPALPG